MNINERFIVFAGSKAGGSQRIPIPFDLEIGQDVEVNIKGHNFTFYVVKQENFDNQDGTINSVSILKSLLE